MDDELNIIREEMKKLILTSLKRKYISTSSHMNYPTGNAYQSVSLADDTLSGYRADRSEFFKIFNFNGRRVLDCGCNIGELSRLARMQGADLVDGIEYDLYFAQIGRLINAYAGTSRVSIFQGDLTDPVVYKSTYDVCLAFSVFPYILPNLEKLASCTREALILETHNVTTNVKTTYVGPLQRYFPHYTYLGTTDFGKGQGDRAVFVFAKALKTLLSGGIIDSSVEIEKSDFDFLAPILEVVRQNEPQSPRTIKDIQSIVDKCRGSFDDAHLLTAGKTYWLEMMRGYLEYVQDGQVTSNNSYVIHFRQALREVKFDAALKEALSSEEALLGRILARFKDVDALLKSSREFGQVDPIRIIIGSDLRVGRYKVAHGSSKAVTGCDYIDGYHRVFWASFLGTKRLPALFCYE